MASTMIGIARFSSAAGSGGTIKDRQALEAAINNNIQLIQQLTSNTQKTRGKRLFKIIWSMPRSRSILIDQILNWRINSKTTSNSWNQSWL